MTTKKNAAASKAKPRAGKAAKAKTGAKRPAMRPAKRAGAATKKAGTKANANNAALTELIKDLGMVMGDFQEAADISTNLTPKERARLIGAGVRNYGFIEKALDIARDNPAFLPPNFNVVEFSNNLQEFDQIRQFYLLAEKLQTLASDSMLLKSNDLYREALRVYNSLKEQTRGRVPGAKDLFNALEIFFKRKRVSENPPTEEQEIKRAASLIKGRTEGEMVIKNIKPKKSGGVHEVIEDIHKDKIDGKATEEFSEQ